MDTASCHFQMAQHFTFTVTQCPVRLQAICWSMLQGLACLQHEARENYAASCQRAVSAVQFPLCSQRHSPGRTDGQTDVRKSKHRTSCQQRFCCHRAPVLTATQCTHGQSASADCYIMYTRSFKILKSQMKH